MPIYKTKKGYKVKNVKGESKTLSDARKRLMAVKSSQKKGKKKGSEMMKSKKMPLKKIMKQKKMMK